MEFEPGHLDADRADDVGTPLLLRPIMWMLGGRDAGSEQHQQQEEGPDTLVQAARSTDSPRISDECDDTNDENINTKGNASPPRFDDDGNYPSPPPGVVRASDGDFCDDASSSEEEHESSPTLDSGGVPSTVAQMAELALSESSATDSNKAAADGRSLLKRSNRFQHPHDRLGKSSRTMSWSDERGNDLATYNYAGRQPSNPDLSAKPIKSAMKSKASGGPVFIRPGSAPDTAPAPASDTGVGGKVSATNSASSKRPKNPSKFLPSGIVGGKGGGVIMPSGGGMGMPSYYPSNSSTTSAASRDSSASSASGTGATGPASGNFSPQWGWYISTTPPSPEKYYAAPPNKKNGKTTERPLGHVPETKPVFHHSNPSPVFKKGGVPSATMGWPTVPL